MQLLVETTDQRPSLDATTLGLYDDDCYADENYTDNDKGNNEL